MPNRVRILTVPDSDRVKLERMARDRGGPARVAERARIVLLAAEGRTGPQIAERVGCSEPTVVKWRRQYAEAGLVGVGGPAPPGGAETVRARAGARESLCPPGAPPAQAARGSGRTPQALARLG